MELAFFLLVNSILTLALCIWLLARHKSYLARISDLEHVVMGAMPKPGVTKEELDNMVDLLSNLDLEGK